LGSLTANRPAEAYEIAGIQALQNCSEHASRGIEDTLYPLLAMSVLSETGGLHGQDVRGRVMEIADAICSAQLASEFLAQAAMGFARCSDHQSAGELLEAAALRRLRARFRERTASEPPA